MTKLGLIIGREYTSRVKNKLFLLSTLGVPLIFGLIMVVPIVSVFFTEEEVYQVLVEDPQGEILPLLKSTTDLTFVDRSLSREEFMAEYDEDSQVMLLTLPKNLDKQALSASVFALSPLSLQMEKKLDRRVEKALEQYKIKRAGLKQEDLDKLEVDFDLAVQQLTEEGAEEKSVVAATIFAYAMGFAIYVLVAMYGGAVMRGVSEEKSNRIVEVMISTVRPLELMFGKIVGIAAVGLTQFVLWIVLIFLVTLGLGVVMGAAGLSPDPEAMQAAGGASAQEQQEMAAKIEKALNSFELSTLWMFLFYFITGYLLYGAILAAIGAAADNEQDSQQLSIVGYLPLIIPILLLNSIVQNPNSSLAFWTSMVPFFSPVIMLVRVAASDVPYWELGLSMALMVAFVVLMASAASRIYRVGIFTYGQKVSAKDLWKWLWIR